MIAKIYKFSAQIIKNDGLISQHFIKKSSNQLQGRQISFCFSTTLWTKMQQHKYYRLCRMDKPIGAMLLFWPVTWGLALGASAIPPISILAMFLMGAWTSRSAGCIINDYLDKDFDKNVERTKLRPLASGEVSNLEAGQLLFGNLLGGLFVLTQLPMQALLATFAVLPVAGLYPLAKRYTNYPQFILGLAFNSGVFIGALTICPLHLNWGPVLLMYASGISWTLIYDTIYAFQDIKDDKKLGLFSTAITWESSSKQKMYQFTGLSLLLSIALPFFDISYILSLPGFILAHTFLAWQLKALNIEDRQSCGKFFAKNTYFGLMILLSLLAKNLYEKDDEKSCQLEVKGTKTE